MLRKQKSEASTSTSPRKEKDVRGKTLKLGALWIERASSVRRFKNRFCVLTSNRELEFYVKQEVLN